MTAPRLVDRVIRTVLPNGLTVLVRPDPSAPVCAIVTHVRSGYFDEPDPLTGIAHVLEHMFFKGTPTRGPGEIARDTKRVGGYLNAGTIYDYTVYYAVLPASGFVAGLDVQFDAYAHSVIDADELRREIEVIVEEERRKRDTPSAVATERTYALLHDAHRMRRWRIGDPDQLRTFGRAEVHGFYRAHYVTSNTILSIVGDLDPDTVLREVTARYGTLPAGTVVHDRGPTEPARQGFRWEDLPRDVARAQLVVGWRTVPPLHPDAAALDVAAVLLGAGRASRLFREVRERSLAATVGAYHYTPTELGVFVLNAEAPSETSAEALAAVWAQVRALAARAPSESELARARRGIEARWWRRLESMEGQATFLAGFEALGGYARGEEALAAQLAVTPAMVQDVVARYLTLDQAAVVTLRPREAAPVAASAATLHAQLDAVATPPSVLRGGTPVSSPALIGLGTPVEAVVGGVHCFRTDAGLPILVRRKLGAPIAHAQVVFRGGVLAEDGAHAGRTALMVRTALQGTATRTSAQLAEDLESVGGSFGNATGRDGFGWYASAPNAVLPSAVALLAEVLESPAFEAAALETERSVALSSLAQLRDDMGRQPLRLALEAAFPGHPYGRPTLGSEAGLRSVDPSGLRRWHEATVRAAEGAIIVVADVDPAEVAAMVRGALRQLRWRGAQPLASAPWPDAPTASEESRDKAQTALGLLWPGPTRASDDRHAALLLATVASGLGGRFFTALRDRESLAYTVHVAARPSRAAGWFTSYLACAPDKEEQARRGLLREWAALADAPVSDDELSRAKAYVLGAHAIRQQSAAAVASEIADAWLADALPTYDTESTVIAAVTAADVQRVARSAVSAAPVWGAVRGVSVAG